jgi:hypothetical protein
MKALIHEIRQQPHHVRELATILCTIAVVAVVALVWFHSFQKDIYAMLNPGDQPQAQDQLFAQQSQSLFGSLISTLGEGKAQISALFSGKSGQTDITNSSAQTDASAAAHPLPVSGNR